MERSWIERHRLKLLVSILLVLLAGWGMTTPSFEWRAYLISLKYRGLLRQASWTDLLLHPTPEERLWGEWNIAAALLKEKARGEEPCPVLWETPMGDFWGREDDVYPLGVVVEEQHFRQIYENGPVRIQNGDVVFDAGSHLGAFTRFALEHGAGLVVAFEPEATNLACYKRTFQQELAAGRIILVEEALWEESGTLDFTTGQHSGAGSVHPSEGNPDAQLVPATTIDETVARLGLDRLDFIKMDIEGSERHALRGGRQSLVRFSPQLAICVYHRPDDREAVPREVLAARPSYQTEFSEYVAFFH